MSDIPIRSMTIDVGMVDVGVINPKYVEYIEDENITLRTRVKELEAELKRYIPSQWRAMFEEKQAQIYDWKCRVDELESELARLREDNASLNKSILDQSGALVEELVRLREQVRWIPVNERDPEYDGFYHVLLFINATLLEDFVEYSNDKWHNIYVKYWTPGLPLPEPPKEE